MASGRKSLTIAPLLANVVPLRPTRQDGCYGPIRSRQPRAQDESDTLWKGWRSNYNDSSGLVTHRRQARGANGGDTQRGGRDW